MGERAKHAELAGLQPPPVPPDARIGSFRSGELVNADASAVDRRLFVDEELYRLEQERIFAKCWLFVGHESQLEANGSFLTTTMAEDPVLVVRDKAGKLRGYLNSCTHRGTKICRADSGRSSTFKCPYHGWTFNSEGALMSVPRLGQVYGENFDRSKHSLREVAKIDSIHGLIFATWDPAAPTLREYLGEMTFYLDLMLARMEGGTELLGGLHKWTIGVNWKIPAENFAGDHYHVPVTHGAGVEMGYRSQLSNDGYCIHTGNGHSIGSERGGAQQGHAVQTEYKGFMDNMRAQLVAKYGEKAAAFVPVGVGTIFPNLSFMDTARFRTFRVWHPRGVDKIEIHSCLIVDRALPEDLKREVRKRYSLAFGPSGIFEQDDGDVWQSIQDSMRGRIGRQGWLNYEMGVGREGPTVDRYGPPFVGSTSDILMTEANQRAYYRQWAKLMTEGDR
ncbi:3-phenylpropionate/cinnamic acid dioxygenase subunit alpha [Bradyrhizobium ivorense]|uniref:3-phenylpropionate/cinnamic acid dioxygenase subunit alpha n=1 Tax=Bradyrhizobium ivorense TaxID=2511166 RepID=A0A508TFA9_9BRAD|nr:aromatic ring-hydroxylating dioxygenase subunit alpha [Bradyrhizobium ivorense]VIO72944.1 3-phenylpropionate/cinnamic acid dioxygenase subunit alpha [Bradyrhizobium ivorense]